jgi:microcystin-dependent protein
MTKSLFNPSQAKFLAGLAIGLAAGWAVSASAQVPAAVTNMMPAGLVNYQGTLLTPENVPYTNGIYDIEFRVYPASSGGTNSVLWGAGYKVFVNNGVFGVMLGQIGGSALNDNPTEFQPNELWKALWFDERAPDNLDLFLGITVKQDQNRNNLASPAEAVPRQQFLVTPFAARAQQAMYARRASDDFDVGGDLNISGKATGIGTVPVGGIIMWSGTTNNIPAGWALCDGQNGTPNLRDRFVMGAGSTYNVGGMGGLTNITLSTSQLPAHAHDFKDIFALQDTINVKAPPGGGSDDLGDDIYAGSYDNDNDNRYAWYKTNTTFTAGSGAPITILPPYYALAYIMRVE